MYAVEFNTKVREGKIDIPLRYQNDFASDVRVILLRVCEEINVQDCEGFLSQCEEGKPPLARGKQGFSDEAMRQKDKQDCTFISEQALRTENAAPQKTYAQMMKEAGCDKNFLQRTASCAEAFAIVDSEVDGEW